MRAYLCGDLVRIGNVIYELTTGKSWKTERFWRAGCWCCEVPEQSFESARYAAKLAYADKLAYGNYFQPEQAELLLFYERNKHKILVSYAQLLAEKESLHERGLV